MSFVKKALKKVWKGVKKVVSSKVFKYVAIAAAIFFTAGVAAGGFAAFSGVSSLPGFFTAVGQTMATGAASIAGGLGFQGLSSGLAAHGGAAATAAGLAGAPAAAGVGSFTGTLAGQTFVNSYTPAVTVSQGGGSFAGVMGGATSGVTTGAMGAAATQAAAGMGASGAGIWGTIKTLLGKQVLGDVTGGQLLTSAALSGVTAFMSAKANKQKEPNGYVAGGLARGGPKEAPPPYSYSFGNSPADPAVADAGPTTAASLATAPEAGQPAGLVPGTVDAGQTVSPFASARDSINRVGARLARRDSFQTYNRNPEPGQGLVMQNPEQAQVSNNPTFGPFYDEATQLQYNGGLV